MQPINVRRPACLLRPERRAIAISLFLGLTVGALDALWDWAFFYKKESFLDVLFFDVTPFEIYIRTLILASFVSFGMIMSRELSKRARVEQSLRREKAFTDNILNALTDSVFVFDPRGRFLRWNRHVTESSGFTDEEIASGRPADFVVPEDRPRVREAIEQVLEHGRVELEATALTKDGGLVPSEFTGTLLRDGDANVVGVCCIGRDVSERKRHEESMERFAAELQKSNRELEHFAYIASHDLQEPLRKIAGFAGFLEKRYRGRLDADADRYINYMVDGAGRLRDLINDLLAYSRITTRGGEFAAVDCNAVVGRVLKEMELSINEKGASVSCGNLPTVTADGDQLAMVFRNLIGNALKFHGEEPPRVVVSAERQGEEWLFSVSDNGIGMEAGDLERIFLMFQRLHGRAEYPGTGIGLAICRKVVERHGGRIWVASEPGRGSTFRFTLPGKGKR
jgi:PAS domain S-box-containing protein